MDQEFILIWSIAIGSAVLLLYLLLTASRANVAQRLSQLETGTTGSSQGSGGRGQAVPRLGNSQVLQELDQKDSRKQLRERIVQAGLYKPHAMSMFITLRIALCVLPIAAGMALSSAGMLTSTQGLIYGGTVGLLGTLAPTFWLDHCKRSRQAQIRRSLPDALDVMVVCLEAGLSMSSALSRVARELRSVHKLLALELCIVEREVQLGGTTGNAMRQFAQRFDLEELRSLSTVITQAEQFGTSVVRAFSIYAETMRTRRHQRAEELAQKATIKVLFPTLLCIFPGIFIVLLGPAAIRIYQVIIMGAKNGTL